MDAHQDDPKPIVCFAKLISFEDMVHVSAETRKISEFGASLRLLEDADMPKRVSILIPKYSINVGCQVVWRHRDEIGLRFDRKIELPELDQPGEDNLVAAG